jgi:hypothetical protein
MPDLVRALDVSNYQPRDLTALIQQYQIQHVIVRLWLPEEKPDPGYSLDQLASAIGNGCTVGGYYWGYATLTPQKSVNDALTLWQRANVGQIPLLWPDIETYADEGCPDEAWTNLACQETEQAGARAGAYSSDSMIDEWWGGVVGPEMAARPYWCANYNGRPDLLVPSKYWPQAMLLGHQYAGSPVDLDVFDPSVTVVPAPAPAPSTAPTYEDLASALGYASHDIPDGLEAEANRKTGPRKGQVLAIAGKLRTLSPT